MNSRDELDGLLGEAEADCEQREQTAFDAATASKPALVLFGAGGLGRKVLGELRAHGIEPLAFADNKLAGQTIERLPVLSPADAAARFGRSATFVVTIWASWADTMREQVASLQSLGCDSVTTFIPLLWKYPHLLPHVQVDLPSRVLSQKADVRRCFELWSDEESRQEFLAQLRWRLAGDFEALRPAVPDQYWQRDLIRLPDTAVFVDAGAFNGDTVEQFVAFTDGRFGAAYAFEPDKQNLEMFAARLSGMPEAVRRRIHVVGCGVAEGDYQISFQGGAGASSMEGAGGEKVRCVALDDAVPEAPDLIKYDIEGFELLGITGSRRLIEEAQPALVVCVYHVQDHLWRVPLLIHGFNPEYRFYLRPHGQVWESVCYALPGAEKHSTA